MNPSTEQIRFVELTSLQDDLLLPWLDLYETAFPAAERVLVSKHLLALKGASDADEPGEHHILAALAGNASFAGLARYQVPPDLGAAYLWYLATAPELRSQGVGTKFYQEIVRRVTGPALRALVIEVEIPARASGGEGEAAAAERALAQRRITFYRRQGARLLEGIHYLQSVGRHQAPIPMHLMFHAFGALDAAQAFALARSLWSEQVKQVGKLRLA
jgi:GNAT superfamily N-acetyltransferase